MSRFFCFMVAPPVTMATVILTMSVVALGTVVPYYRASYVCCTLNHIKNQNGKKGSQVQNVFAEDRSEIRDKSGYHMS
jgi:hypothetical protein